MKIAENVINHIKNNSHLKALFCIELNVHFGTIERYLKENIEDGPLIHLKSIRFLEKHTGLPMDKIVTEAIPA